MEDRPTPYIRC